MRKSAERDGNSQPRRQLKHWHFRDAVWQDADPVV